MDLTKIIDKLLDMNPDPIPEFVLMKEFRKNDPNSTEYQNLYEKVQNHKFVKRFEDSQNERGFWYPFHGYTEGIIRHLLSYGLDKNHICLKRVSGYLVKVLQNNESWDQFEKQDNIRWWPEIFVPLVTSAMLSLIDNTNELLEHHRKRWAFFAEKSLKLVDYNCNDYNLVKMSPSSNACVSRGVNINKKVVSITPTSVETLLNDYARHKNMKSCYNGTHEKHSSFFSSSVEKKGYDYQIDQKTQNEHFGFNTKKIITPWNYYNLLLLSPHNGVHHLNNDTDKALTDYCMNEADFIYYIYNKNPGEMISIDEQNRDSRDFCHWIRALSLIAQFKGWEKYEHKYFDWIMNQRNNDGLWEFPKKFDLYALSNSWKGNNRAIDSTIYVLRLLMKKQAF